MKTYYNDTPRRVSLENKSLNRSDVKAYFNALSPHKESYIGIIDVYDDVIIFKWLANDKWLVEHLVVPNTLHRQRYATEEECVAMIENVYQECDVSGFEGFIDVPVGEFTLDEMTAFKEEDEMALREEEPIAKVVIQAPKITITPQKTHARPSLLLGELPNSTSEESKLNPMYIGTDKIKPSTSPLQQFKQEAEQSRTKEQPIVTKTVIQPVSKKTNNPRPTQTKTDDSIMSLGGTIESKKEEKIIAIPAPKKAETEEITSKKRSSNTLEKSPPKKPTKKPSGDDSFFSI